MCLSQQYNSNSTTHKEKVEMTFSFVGVALVVCDVCVYVGGAVVKEGEDN